MIQDHDHLRVRLKELEARNRELEKLVKLAAKVIKKQREQLDDVQIYTWSVIQEARKVMSQHQPPGTWALWKGRLEVAKKVYSLVWVNWSAAFWEMVAGIKGL